MDASQPCARHDLRWCGDCNTVVKLSDGSTRMVPPGTLPEPGPFSTGFQAPSVPASPADWAELYERSRQPQMIEAAYHGACRACGGRWEPGDPIAWSDDEDGWVHEDCAGIGLPVPDGDNTTKARA